MQSYLRSLNIQISKQISPLSPQKKKQQGPHKLQNTGKQGKEDKETTEL